MKVLQLCGKDFFGAGRAAYRLHKGLQNSGVNSIMWVGAKRSQDSSVTDIQASYFKKKLTKVYVNIEKLYIKSFGFKINEMFSVGMFGHAIRDRIEKEKPDILHLHWVNRGFLNMKELQGLKIPVVISLHDMWWFTGGCHYDEECENYLSDCGKCPVILSNKRNDVSFKHQKSKVLVLDSIEKLVFVGLSSWMAESVRQSKIGHNHQVAQLPNGIDISVFKPVNTEISRNKLNLPLDKKLILFAAVDPLSVSRKGFKYIREALTKFTDDYELVVIGETSQEQIVSGLKAHFVSEINDDQILIHYLSAVDVIVVPSLQENLSNLIMEGLSCATPVVGFNIGGNGDMIVHKENGYLAVEKDVEDMVTGIKYCCEEIRNKQLGINARNIVKEKFNIEKVSQQYIDLYQSLINEQVND